jgi:heat shock protein HslJ
MSRSNITQVTRARRGAAGRLAAAVALVAMVVLAGCGSSDSGDATTTTKASGDGTGKTTTTAASGDSELDGRQYVASGVTGYEPVAGSQLTMTFDDGQLSVNAGCNTLGGTYEFADGTLKWTGEPRATMMACSDELMAQDTWLTDLLTAGVEAKVDGTTLTLSSDDVTITLDEVKDSPLTGTTWTLDGTIANEAVSSLPADAKAPTLTIADDGAVTVFTGCNNGQGTVKIGDDTLTFAPLATTRKFCEGTGSQLEGQVTTVLDGEVTFTIDGSSLTIMNGDSGLVYKAG